MKRSLFVTPVLLILVAIFGVSLTAAQSCVAQVASNLSTLGVQCAGTAVGETCEVGGVSFTQFTSSTVTTVGVEASVSSAGVFIGDSTCTANRAPGALLEGEAIDQIVNCVPVTYEGTVFARAVENGAEFTVLSGSATVAGVDVAAGEVLFVGIQLGATGGCDSATLTPSTPVTASPNILGQLSVLLAGVPDVAIGNIVCASGIGGVVCEYR